MPILISLPMLYLATRARSHSAETQRALHAADGYLALGMHREALDEFGGVHASERSEPGVMLAHNRVLLHLRRWQDAEEMAARGARLHPDEEEFTVQRAFALQQMQRAELADEILSSAPDRIRRTGILHYNLACYEARLGDLHSAQNCMDTAISLNAAIQRNARKDPDLAALWN